jgi:hypothetical protein
MNYRGSYRHLLRNSKSALLAAIEIYNKPRIQYRDECFVILLLNAWELLLKAIISKNGGSIFYQKRRHEPYKTVSLNDAIPKAEKHFPAGIQMLAVRRNLDLLSTYRDNAVHFYNERQFGTVVYALAQTSIVNFKDVLLGAFSQDLADEVNWSLLPLGVNPPIDPIDYISGKTAASEVKEDAVRQFLREIQSAADEVQKAGGDTGRVLTIFKVKLESTKKIQKADVLVGVTKEVSGSGPLAVVKSVDPNLSHPHRQKDIVQQLKALDGVPFTPHVFTAVAWKFELKAKPAYCWKASEGVLTKYSPEVIKWFQTLSAGDVNGALKDYREYLRTKATSKTRPKTQATIAAMA